MTDNPDQGRGFTPDDLEDKADEPQPTPAEEERSAIWEVLTPLDGLAQWYDAPELMAAQKWLTNKLKELDEAPGS